MDKKKKDRFIVGEGDVKVTGKRAPSGEDLREADEVFDKILKNKKVKKS